MGISVFPAGGGEFVTNDFVVDMNDTTNNVATLGGVKAAGSYGVTLSSGDTSFDIYAIDSDGNSVGYTNEASLVATAEFTQIVILGVSSSEVVSFDYNGAVSNTDSEGDVVGAGAYLTSISPFDLPNVDDTANIIGGNFATDVEIYFESGTVSTAAKQVARADSTALIVTRPDALDPALDPWDVKAINPGVTPPTGSNAHILAGTVDAGATPVWVTTSPLTGGTLNSAYSGTLEATDADGAVTYSITAGSLPTGLSLNSSSGVISGTPTTGSETFTALATDEGGNTNSREFALPIALATGGSVSTIDGYTTHIFETSDDFVALTEITGAEYLVIAGGGGGGGTDEYFSAPGGGGAGGFLSSISGETGAGGSAVASPITISAGTVAITVGAGGSAGTLTAQGSDGGDSSIAGFATAIGGGGGGAGQGSPNGRTGGSGGGAGTNQYGNAGNAGSGTSGQGFAGANISFSEVGGSGGGAGSAATPNSNNPVDGVGVGVSSSATGTAVTYARGGAGGGTGQKNFAAPNSGTTAGGGGGAPKGSNATPKPVGDAGQNGLVIVRYQ